MDLAGKSGDNARADLERVAREYAPCDIVAADIDSGTPDQRVLELIGWCAELSERYGT